MDFEELYKANKILQKHEPNRFPLENNYVKAMHEYAVWYHKKLSQHDVSGRSEQLPPEQECYKSGKPCKYNCSGLCKESC